MKRVISDLDAEYVALKTKADSLAAELRAVAQRMGQLQAAIASLTALEGELPDYEGKITPAIRAILALLSKPLTTGEIRDYLKIIRYDLSQHDNPMATINMVLKRLIDAGEAQLIDQRDGSMRYRQHPDNRVDPDQVLMWLSGRESGPSGSRTALHRQALITHADTEHVGRMSDYGKGTIGELLGLKNLYELAHLGLEQADSTVKRRSFSANYTSQSTDDPAGRPVQRRRLAADNDK